VTYYGENDGFGDARGQGNIFGGSRYLKWHVDEFAKTSPDRTKRVNRRKTPDRIREK